MLKTVVADIIIKWQRVTTFYSGEFKALFIEEVSALSNSHKKERITKWKLAHNKLKNSVKQTLLNDCFFDIISIS